MTNMTKLSWRFSRNLKPVAWNPLTLVVRGTSFRTFIPKNYEPATNILAVKKNLKNIVILEFFLLTDHLHKMKIAEGLTLYFEVHCILSYLVKFIFNNPGSRLLQSSFLKYINRIIHLSIFETVTIVKMYFQQKPWLILYTIAWN